MLRSLLVALTVMLLVSLPAYAQDVTVNSLIDDDQENAIDHIGYAMPELPDQGTPDFGKAMGQIWKYLAQDENGVGFLTACVDMKEFDDDVPDGALWIGCLMVVMNMGTEEQTVTTNDFALVNNDGVRYVADIELLAGTDDDEVFMDETVVAQQYVQKLIAFSLPADERLPLYMEIAPALTPDADSVYIILDTLVEL